MFRHATRVPQRFGNLLGVTLAILAVLWIGTGGNGQPAVQDKIKRKLIIAEQLGLDVPGAKASVRFAKSADGRASLEFLDATGKRSLRLSVASTGSPALFVTTTDPRHDDLARPWIFRRSRIGNKRGKPSGQAAAPPADHG